MDALLAWYNANMRDLPWRRNTELYPVWISEIMLQQTRVATVEAYHNRWMGRFPTVELLAAASEDDVLSAWSGLGYYSRARNLHKAAKMVAADGWPADLHVLPGIGPYTAAALASICRNEPVAVVDGNVERVVSRLGAIEENVRGAGKQMIAQQAQSMLRPKRPGDWNQAMMELGAIICKPAPICPTCPVQQHCRAFELGIQDRLPVKPTKKPPREETKQFALLESDLGVLMVRRGEEEMLAGTWGLPEVRDVLAKTGFLVESNGATRIVRHVFTHRIWNMEIIPCKLLDASHAHHPDSGWIKRDEMASVGLSTAMRKALNL